MRESETNEKLGYKSRIKRRAKLNNKTNSINMNEKLIEERRKPCQSTGAVEPSMSSTSPKRFWRVGWRSSPAVILGSSPESKSEKGVVERLTRPDSSCTGRHQDKRLVLTFHRLRMKVKLEELGGGELRYDVDSKSQHLDIIVCCDQQVTFSSSSSSDPRIVSICREVVVPPVPGHDGMIKVHCLSGKMKVGLVIFWQFYCETIPHLRL